MASPFRVFRKYQKSLIAVAGVILIFVFVLSDSLTQYMQNTMSGSGTPKGRLPGDVAVEWNGGKLTNIELAQLVQRRILVSNFIRGLEMEGRRAAFDSGVQPQPLTVDFLALPETTEQGVEQDVVRARIFADAARAAGMRMSDQYIATYLQEIGRNFFGVDQIGALIRQLQFNGRPATVDYVLDGLRDELLARNFLATYKFALTTVLPEQRWEDWRKANDRVVVEAAAVPAESFVVDVPDPTDAELTEFFDKYKDREPQPEFVNYTELPSAEPGFRVPRKVAIQFVTAEYDRFLAQAEEKVTEEQIQKFYDDNKERLFERAETPSSDSDAPAGATTDAPGATSESTETPPSDQQPADDKAGEEKSSGKEGASLESTKKNPFRLVAFAQDEKANEAPAGGAAATEPADIEKPKEYQPLDEVRDQIRRQIASQSVADQLDETMGDLQGQLYGAFTSYFGARLDATASNKELPEPPEELVDLTPLAKKYELLYQKTEPVSILQMRDLPIGKSVKSEESSVPLLAAIYSKVTELYQPIRSFDIDNNQYLSMKTSDAAGRVPTLDEVRDEVVRVWKLRKAADLALTRAKDLAAKAESAGTPLEEIFAEDKSVTVTKTDPFSWLTIGNVSRAQQVESFRLSEPEGITAAGPEFMQTVFGLGEGKVGAVLNNDRSIAYVVRIAEHQSSPAELHKDFLTEADSWYGMRAMLMERAQQIQTSMQRELVQSAGIKWNREADRTRQSDENAD